jgi:hypothetical protein
VTFADIGEIECTCLLGVRLLFLNLSYVVVYAQECIAHRRKLEARLFRLQHAYDMLRDEADYLRQTRGPTPALNTSLGRSDAVLVAVYIGGRVWQRFYGPLYPSIPIDR